MDQETLDFLKSKPLQSLPIMGFFRHYTPEVSIRRGDFLLLAGTSDFNWAFLCGDNPEDMLQVLERYNYQSSYFANVEEWMLPVLTHHRKIEWKLYTHRYYLPDSVVTDEPVPQARSLDASLAPYIFAHSSYRDFTSEVYIRERISLDVSAGIWMGEELAGWGLTHDDSSLGFLNVIPSWRGKGLGEKILCSLINEKRKMGDKVFVNIEPHNHQSVNLIKKLGFHYDREVSWLKLTSA